MDCAQLVKLYGAEPSGDGRYAPPQITEVVSTMIKGNPDPARICTRHVERQDLTIRMMCRRFTRLSNAFGKKPENLEAALALHFAYYDLYRVHHSLHVTPAMAVEVTDRAWGLSELIG